MVDEFLLATRRYEYRTTPDKTDFEAVEGCGGSRERIVGGMDTLYVGYAPCAVTQEAAFYDEHVVVVADDVARGAEHPYENESGGNSYGDAHKRLSFLKKRCNTASHC